MGGLRRLHLGLTLVVSVLIFPEMAIAQNAVRFPWEPSAKVTVPEHKELAEGKLSAAELARRGELLFSARFTVDDGLGRPGATGDSKPTIRIDKKYPTLLRTAGPDANSCAGCHNQPRVGGSGDFVTNVFVGAQFSDPPTMSVSVDATNERNTNSMFGAGLVELVAREITADLLKLKDDVIESAQRSSAPVSVRLMSKGIDYGELTALPDGSLNYDKVEGIDLDLVVKPFGSKGVAVSLREFTNFALNHHHGIQPTERFGWTRTGIRDFDSDGVEDEFNTGQVTALTLFQAALRPPTRRRAIADPIDKSLQHRGEVVFSEIGCSQCHRPTLPLKTNLFSEPNPYNRWGSLQRSDGQGVVEIEIDIGSTNLVKKLSDGTFEVSIFTDFKRHRICDRDTPHFCNEKRRQDFVPQDQFLTTKLWDAGSSAPYGHRGDLSTITEAILNHGAEARPQRDRFVALAVEDKRAMIAYLRSLQVCPITDCKDVEQKGAANESGNGQVYSVELNATDPIGNNGRESASMGLTRSPR